MAVYGYMRVSTREQNEGRQRDALEKYGVPQKNVYLDKQSGKDFVRLAYLRMLSRLKKGDLLVVKSIDRLGRNYTDVMKQWRTITQKKRADIKVLDMPLLDTTREKDLLGTLIADIVLQLLSFVAENERSNIRQRQAEGIAAAKARGVKFGRPRACLPQNFRDICAKWEAGSISAAEAVRAAGIPQSTFYRKAQEYKKSDA